MAAGSISGTVHEATRETSWTTPAMSPEADSSRTKSVVDAESAVRRHVLPSRTIFAVGGRADLTP